MVTHCRREYSVSVTHNILTSVLSASSEERLLIVWYCRRGITAVSNLEMILLLTEITFKTSSINIVLFYFSVCFTTKDFLERSYLIWENNQCSVYLNLNEGRGGENGSETVENGWQPLLMWRLLHGVVWEKSSGLSVVTDLLSYLTGRSEWLSSAATYPPREPLIGRML